MKSCEHGIVFSFLLLPIALTVGFKVPKSCSFMKVNIMSRMCKSHKVVLVTYLIFCNLKASGKIQLGFCRGNQAGLQKHIISAVLSEDVLEGA